MKQFEVKTIGPKIEIGNFDVSFTNSSLFMLITVSLISIFLIITTQKKSWPTFQRANYKLVRGNESTGKKCTG